MEIKVNKRQIQGKNKKKVEFFLIQHEKDWENEKKKKKDSQDQRNKG